MLRYPILPAVLVVALAGISVTPQPVSAQTPLPIPPVWDTAYVMLLEANPEYRPASQEEAQATVQAHIQYQLSLVADGRTIRGGPLVEAPDASLVGMTVLRAASATEAEAIALADPGVAAGLFRTTVRTWTTPAAAPPPEPEPAGSAADSVIVTVQEFLRAMSANDVAASRRLMRSDGVGFSTRQTPDRVEVRREANEEYFAWLATNQDRMVERIWDPSLSVHGAIATLWAPYDFHVNGEFTHCGINAVSLLRTEGRWQIANWVWTVETEGCEPSPLGSPPEE